MVYILCDFVFHISNNFNLLSQTTDATTTTGATQTTPKTKPTKTTPQTTTASCQEPQLCDCVAAETIELGTVTQGSLNEESPIFPEARPGSGDMPACGFDDQTGAIVSIEPGSPVAWYQVLGTGGLIKASTCSRNSGGSATFDSEISVFDSCEGAGLVQDACVGGNGDTRLCAEGKSQTFTSTVLWQSILNRPYYLLVHAFEGDVGGGTFDLDVSDNSFPLIGFIPDGSKSSDTLFLPGDEDCSSIDNVVVTFAVDFSTVGALVATLTGPDGTIAILLDQPAGDRVGTGFKDISDLSPSNPLTFDDSDGTALDPDTIGLGILSADDVPEGVYYSVGNGKKSPPGVGTTIKGNPESLTDAFVGKSAAGSWGFALENTSTGSNGSGSLFSVELTFECGN